MAECPLYSISDSNKTQLRKENNTPNFSWENQIQITYISYICITHMCLAWHIDNSKYY